MWPLMFGCFVCHSVLKAHSWVRTLICSCLSVLGVYTCGSMHACLCMWRSVLRIFPQWQGLSLNLELLGLVEADQWVSGTFLPPPLPGLGSQSRTTSSSFWCVFWGSQLSLSHVCPRRLNHWVIPHCYCGIIFHFVDTLYLISPFIICWSFGLLSLLWGTYE